MIHGWLVIEQRSSSVTVQTCPMLRDETVTDKIYGQVQTVYTHENGSYTITTTVAAENVGDSESCPVPETSEATTPPEGGWGELLSAVTTFSSPVDRASVLGDLPGIDWEDWTDSGYGYDSPSPAVLHSHLVVDAVIGLGTSKSVSGVDAEGGGLGSISASRTDAQVRFRIYTPLACTVVYQLGSQFTPVYGDEDPEFEITWGSDLTAIVTEESVITLPVEEDYQKLLRITGIIWHPWT